MALEWSANTEMINFHIFKNIKNKRGSLTVEAAILLPLFIIGVLSIGYLLKLVMIEENVFHSFSDESHKLASEAKYNPVFPLYEKDLVARLYEENGSEIANVDVGPILYRLPSAGLSGKVYTNLIGVSVNYDIPLKILPIFKKEIKGEETIVCRAFVGKDNKGDVKPFEEMEEKDDDFLVWIFPRAGEKYHGEECSYIKNNPKEMLLSPSVKRKYTACELCNPAGLPVGSLVYCFATSGKAYHRGNCYIVDRYVISISEDDAKDQGYSACSKCNGGGEGHVDE